MNGIVMPSTKRGLATFEKICRAAEMLFHTRGYNATTVFDIVTEAGVANGTFYLYFEDKYSIFRRLLLEYSHRIRSTIAIATEGLTDRREKERIGIQTFIKYVRDNPQSYTIIWQSLQIDKKLFIDYYSNFAAHYITRLKTAEEDGQLKPYDPLTTAYFLMGVSNFVGLQVILFDSEHSSDADIDRIVDQVMMLLDNGLFDVKK